MRSKFVPQEYVFTVIKRERSSEESERRIKIACFARKSEESEVEPKQGLA